MTAGSFEVVASGADAVVRGSGLTAKRVIDVVLGFFTLVMFSPVFAAAAVFVKSTSTGPVFYRQRRVGRGGVAFEVVKFRTMRVGAHEEILTDPVARSEYESNGWKVQPDDPRITAVGRWLRKTSFDELPQLLNVLVGDMSLVGVRPLLADELAERSARDQQLYRSMRPGMTGLWQVEGRSTLDGVDRLELDRIHVEQWSLWRDVLLLARTPAAVLRVSHTH